MVKIITKEQLEDAGKILKLSEREIVACALSENDKWEDTYQLVMNIKNQKINEKLVLATQILAGTTIILSILTLCLQYIR